LEVAVANQSNLNCKSGGRGRPPHTVRGGVTGVAAGWYIHLS